MKHNLLRKEEDSDPISVVSNLFDIAMVFAVALMVALVSRYNMTEVFSQEDYTMVKNPGKENMEIITKEGNKINRYTPSEDQDKKEGKRGKKVGIVIGFVLNYAAYFAEIYRSGIQSIPVGQYEAAKILGYSKGQTFFKIILPQVIKRILPAVTNEVITLVKDTSLAFVLAVTEMFTLAKQVAAAQTTIVPLMAAGVFYYLFNLLVAFVMETLEKKMAYYR